MSRSGLARLVEHRGSAIQAALYPRGLHAHGMEGIGMVHIYALKEPPWEVVAVRLDDESLQAAAAATDWALERLASLVSTYGDAYPWPGPAGEDGGTVDLHLHGLVRRFGEGA